MLCLNPTETLALVFLLPILSCTPIGQQGEPAPPSCIELTNREQADTGVTEYVRAAEMQELTYKTDNNRIISSVGTKSY